MRWRSNINDALSVRTIATIVFIPEKGEPVTVEVVDGKYTVAGVPAGNATITVETKSKKEEIPQLEKMIKSPPTPPEGGPKPPPQAQEQMIAGLKSRLEKLKKLIEVPAVYADPKTSGLSYTVQVGKQEHDVQLQKK